MGINVWEQIETNNASGGLWQELSETLVKKPQVSKLNIWLVLDNRPGGYWHDLEDETILLKSKNGNDIWQETNDETLILRPSKDVWDLIKNTPETDEVGKGIWQDVNDETLILNKKKQAVWRISSQQQNITQEKPKKHLGWALKKLNTTKGENYYILKNIRLDKYLRINEQQVFLWDLMDGVHSIQDIAVAFFAKYQSLPIQNLLSFLGQLEENGFLSSTNMNIFDQTSDALGQRAFGFRLNQLLHRLRRSTLSFKDIDGIITKLYKNGLFLFFTWPVQIIMLIITIGGLISFFLVSQEINYSLIHNVHGNIPLGILGLYIAFIISIFLHELSHALTCKHFGREVHQAGIMLYLGLPAFFVDTTDIWMEKRKPRILVSLAGPYSGLFLAGLSSIILLISPNSTINVLLYQFAFSSLLLTLTNLNPLIMLDGYYILMDWMEMPMLRARAIHFATRKFWKKLVSRKRFSHEERILAVFGVLALTYTVIIIFSILKLYGNRLMILTTSFFGPTTGRLFFYIAWILVFIIILWPYIYKVLNKKTE